MINEANVAYPRYKNKQLSCIFVLIILNPCVNIYFVSRNYKTNEREFTNIMRYFTFVIYFAEIIIRGGFKVRQTLV